MDLACGDDTARLAFPERIVTPGDLRKVLVVLAAQARDRSASHSISSRRIRSRKIGRQVSAVERPLTSVTDRLALVRASTARAADDADRAPDTR